MLASVSFPDEVHGWAVGDSGILVTSDAGETWTAQTPPTSQRMNAVHFADAAHGWIVGNTGAIFATEDGGITWETQTSSNDYDLYDVHFSNSQSGWAVGYGTLGRSAGVYWTTRRYGIDSSRGRCCRASSPSR